MRTTASLRSSFSANPLRATLWIAAVVVAIALIVAVLVGLRPHHASPASTRRAIVGAYIVRVGRIQLIMGPQVRAVDAGYKKFAKDPRGLSARVAQYRRAEQTLARLRDRLAAVTPPREARKLHALLVSLADQNVAVAGAVTGLAAYLPRLAKEQAPMRQALLTLRGGIAKAKTAKAQAQVFRDYATSTAALARHIAALPAPSFFVAARDAEASQLRRASAISVGIAQELLRKHRQQAQVLVQRLAQVNSETAVARAQRAGALAYDARVVRIQTTAKQIEAERKRLEKSVRA
jgi:hypothetical protein